MLLNAHAAGQAATLYKGEQPRAADPVAHPLSLEQAIVLALSSSPELRSVAQNVAIAEGARVQAGLVPNPEFSILREGMQQGTRTQTVQVSQALELGGKRGARMNLADQDLALAAGDVGVGRTNLRADVTTAYLEALTAQERVSLAQASLDLAAKATRAAARRVAAGKISPLEQTRSSVAEAGVRLELSQAVAEASLAKRRLAALWGSTQLMEQPLVMPEIDLSAIPSIEDLQARLEISPQMQRARMQIVREEAQVKLERATRIPDLTVTLGNKKDNELNRSQTVVGLSVPLPLFNRNQGNLLSALRRVDKAKAEAEVERLRLTQALMDAYQRAQVAQEQIGSMRNEILPSAQSAFEAAVTGFELGKFGFLDVLDAQRTLFQNRAQYLRALSDRYRSIADLQRYVAVENSNGISPTIRNTK
jgi:cobalt-zinc-cadmium efflux system outer membrane protein